MCYYFSSGGKFRPVSNLTELHALTQAARSYVPLGCKYMPTTKRSRDPSARASVVQLMHSCLSILLSPAIGSKLLTGQVKASLSHNLLEVCASSREYSNL